MEVDGTDLRVNLQFGLSQAQYDAVWSRNPHEANVLYVTLENGLIYRCYQMSEDTGAPRA